MLQQRSDEAVDGGDPPFLQERSVAVDPELARRTTDVLIDFVYRWRLALALGLVPVLLAALALSIDPTQPDDPLVAADDQVRRSGVEAASTDSSSSVTSTTVGASVSASPLRPAELPALPPAAPSTSPESTPTSSTGSTGSTTAEDPPPTAPPTTDPPTTAPPPTEPTSTDPPTTTSASTPPEPACIVSVSRRAPLRTEPDDDADRIERIRRGSYPGLGADDGWFLVDADGTIGWVEDRFVAGIEGDC